MMPGGHGISIKMKGKTIKTMISEERIREVFTELAAVDSESFSEKEIGEACAGEKLESRRITTLGGSDANRLNAAGIHTIVIANGMQNVHSTSEYTRLSDLKRCAELTLKLMTIE